MNVNLSHNNHSIFLLMKIDLHYWVLISWMELMTSHSRQNLGFYCALHYRLVAIRKRQCANMLSEDIPRYQTFESSLPYSAMSEAKRRENVPWGDLVWSSSIGAPQNKVQTTQLTYHCCTKNIGGIWLSLYEQQGEGLAMFCLNSCLEWGYKYWGLYFQLQSCIRLRP